MKDLAKAMPLCIIELQDGKPFLAIEHGNNYYCLERETHYTRGLDYDDIRHVESLSDNQYMEDKIDWSKLDVTYNEQVQAQIEAYREHNKHLV